MIVPIACGFAIGVGFAAFSVLQLFETVIEYPPVGGVAQPARPGVFGLPWDEVARPLIGLAGAMGAFCAARALTSPSPLWRFHVPFALGLLLLISAFSVTVSALWGAAVSWGNSAHIWPVPMQVAVLTMFGLFALLGACYRDR